MSGNYVHYAGILRLKEVGYGASAEIALRGRGVGVGVGVGNVKEFP
jgi:hypothetical protein